MSIIHHHTCNEFITLSSLLAMQNKLTQILNKETRPVGLSIRKNKRQ